MLQIITHKRWNLKVLHSLLPFYLQYQMLPSGDKQSYGSILELLNVSRHDSGTYICEAANGVDNPVRSKIDLQIICKYMLPWDWF